MKNALAVFLCGIVMFVWGIASWMVLPWHENAANRFADESEVAEVIRKNAPEAGIYWLPFADENYEAGENQRKNSPKITAAVSDPSTAPRAKAKKRYRLKSAIV